MKENKCKECGLCCLETEMTISEKDIQLILETKQDLKQEDFVIKGEDELYQLKNTEGHCVFLSPTTITCEIYEVRPKGCRFYPLIYDLEQKKCIFDDICPNPALFYDSKTDIQTTCKQIRTFLSNELKLNI